eukprot:jgi/Ulvmu1/7614/UM038_0039.1
MGAPDMAQQQPSAAESAEACKALRLPALGNKIDSSSNSGSVPVAGSNEQCTKVCRENDDGSKDTAGIPQVRVDASAESSDRDTKTTALVSARAADGPNAQCQGGRDGLGLPTRPNTGQTADAGKSPIAGTVGRKGAMPAPRADAGTSAVRSAGAIDLVMINSDDDSEVDCMIVPS